MLLQSYRVRPRWPRSIYSKISRIRVNTFFIDWGEKMKKIMFKTHYV